VLKIHGSSSARAVKNAILKGIPYAEHNVVQTIENAVLELEEIITSE
jgi:glycerol-3-phosphate acyltransferase PlsX